MVNVDTTETTHLSFCAGYGGIDLGLQRVLPSCRTVAYVEIEAFAIANLVAKMEAGDLDAAPVWTDIKTFPAEPFRGLVDIISGGYPCQPFSAAGKRLGTEDPRHLWPFLRRAIRVIQPGRVFLENVEGHISLGLSTVISDLDEDGYRATWGIFSAAEVGASHQRKRVFILGRLADTGCITGTHQRTRSLDSRGSISAEDVPPKTQNEQEWGGGGSRKRQDASGNISKCSCGGTKLDNSECEGLEGHTWPEANPQRWQTQVRSVAPPGSQQHSWEEPRTVVTKLGGAVDGCTSAVDATANRVDRLRLLGNGVVPATAARAWTVLSKRFPGKW